MKQFLLAVSMLVIQNTFAQKIVEDHYTPSGGLLGAANFSKFRVKDQNNLSYSTEFGWGAGVWFNFPLIRAVSFEPQVMYNSYAYATDATSAFLKDTKVGYVAVPLLMKFHLGEKFAITAGPQFDFVTSVKDDNNIYKEEDLMTVSVALNAGIEVFPRARLVPFARYIYGFTDMDNTGNPVFGKFYNQNIQAGLKLRLFGKHILADSDGDGIVDKNDKCPNQLASIDTRDVLFLTLTVMASMTKKTNAQLLQALQNIMVARFLIPTKMV